MSFDDPLNGDKGLPPYSDLPEASTSSTPINQAARKGETSAPRNQPPRKGETAVDVVSEPPAFSEHRAAISLNALGDVVSHDPHLNEDGEALARFITMHARSTPELWLSVRGEHDEHRTETYHDAKDGRFKTKTTTVTVQDFSFEVPVHTAQDPDLRGRLYVVPPELPAWRGKGVFRRSGLAESAIALPDLEAGPSHDRLRGSPMGFRERARADGLWAKFRQRGLPPFVAWAEVEHHAISRTPYYDEDGYEHALMADELEALGDEGYTSIHDGRIVDREVPDLALRLRNEAQTRTSVREWCDAYCAEARPLKQFDVSKGFDSWHMARIQAAVRSHIRRSPYSGRITLAWRQTSSSIRVLPDSRLARIFTLPWPFKLLLTLCLIYPLLVLVRRFFLGARFDAVRCTYSLTRWIPLRDAPPKLTEPTSAHPRRKPPAVARLRNERGEEEDWVLLGQTEDAWLAQWRDRLTLAVRQGARGPLTRSSS